MAHAGVRGISGVVFTHSEDVGGGAPLENFLDHHLDRWKGYVLMKPAFLDDPGLQLPNDASDSYVGSPDHSSDTGSRMPSSTESEPPEASPEQSRGREAGDRNAEELYERQTNPKKDQDLHPDAQRLDR